MQGYQQKFIEFALENEVLRFGSFTLKSGRISPYFFNAAKFDNGAAFQRLGDFYAETIKEHFAESEYDILFGPAYKGIALATATSIGLYNHYQQNVPVCFNRKEAKDHGEGGVIIGSSLRNKKALLIDDVITAGTTVREAIEIISRESGKLVGGVIALDRQEKGLKSSLSAIQEVEQTYHMKVASIISLKDLIEYLSLDTQRKNHLAEVLKYRETYGVAV